jgi:bifunctional UDP-N-acetylglucosamine pyrophosphorylase/glucosamine-1-phosphate N-acetyltransferase
VLDIMNYYLDQIDGQVIAEDAFIAPGATLVGNVYIGSGATVFPGAAVVGPAYIGSGTIVGNNALVRNSMVLDNCEVGFTTEIARSYVAEGCAMHACRVLDSVFAENVNFSAGCTTANLRIDHGDVPSIIKGQKIYSGRDKFGAVIGRGAFLAVDVMTMPGVKIGEKANIGPGTHVHKDVLDGQRVYVKQVLEIVDDNTD